MTFISLSMVTRGAFDEDTGAHNEASQSVVINANCIRCFYARRDDKPGTRITFNDGGGFAVHNTPDEVEALIVPLAS